MLLRWRASSSTDEKYPDGAAGQKVSAAAGTAYLHRKYCRQVPRLLEAGHGGLAQQGTPISEEFQEAERPRRQNPCVLPTRSS